MFSCSINQNVAPSPSGVAGASGLTAGTRGDDTPGAAGSAADAGDAGSGGTGVAANSTASSGDGGAEAGGAASATPQGGASAGGSGEALIGGNQGLSGAPPVAGSSGSGGALGSGGGSGDNGTSPNDVYCNANPGCCQNNIPAVNQCCGGAPLANELICPGPNNQDLSCGQCYPSLPLECAYGDPAQGIANPWPIFRCVLPTSVLPSDCRFGTSCASGHMTSGWCCSK